MLRTPFDFTGYRVLVAGGNRDIGRRIALHLASPWAGWITGHTLVVDGGKMLHG